MIVSMDALFGLPRKKSAGVSLRQPLHGMLFFEGQDEVDTFVEAASMKMGHNMSKVMIG